ncbi:MULTISPECIES: hypothetical protein [unclassified Streptomyces]|uniref:hypothetical protein n=1 Tax=unclassified Streptomyces TaxID=2593676 RepID=UPI001E583348|nr:hypothetical protein [Streptomyces sp. CB02980]MCB8908349.1 hypothetical protein [Streptomyces sp. CB02980]
MLKQQRDHSVNLCGAVDPPGDVDLHRPSGVMSDGRFEDRHILGISIGEEVAGLLIVDVDVEVAVQSPWIALLGQMPIERGDGLGSLT